MLAVITMPAVVSAVKMDVKPYGMIDLVPGSYVPTSVHLYEMQCDGTLRTLYVDVKSGTPGDLTFKIDGLENDGSITYTYTPTAGTTEYDIQVEIKAAAGTEGNEYIIYYEDVQSGKIDEAGASVRGTAIPEFATIAIPVATILGLLFFFNYRKRRRVR